MNDPRYLAGLVRELEGDKIRLDRARADLDAAEQAGHEDAVRAAKIAVTAGERKVADVEAELARVGDGREPRAKTRK